MKKIKIILKDLFHNIFITYYVYKNLIIDKNSYLILTGWHESLKRGYPCNIDGAELPWMNYSIISFLEQRLNKNLSVFEYGSGYSTFFFSRHVKNVTSVEHDIKWYNTIKRKMPKNVKLIFKMKDYNGDYCRSINLNDEEYDLVVIDGRDRVNCLKQAVEKLSERGVIILDDSNRGRYSEAIIYAKNKGFLTLDVEGLKPAGHKIDRATIIYRNKNCLNI